MLPAGHPLQYRSAVRLTPPRLLDIGLHAPRMAL